MDTALEGCWLWTDWQNSSLCREPWFNAQILAWLTPRQAAAGTVAAAGGKASPCSSWERNSPGTGKALTRMFSQGVFLSAQVRIFYLWFDTQLGQKSTFLASNTFPSLPLSIITVCLSPSRKICLCTVCHGYIFPYYIYSHMVHEKKEAFQKHQTTTKTQKKLITLTRSFKRRYNSSVNIMCQRFHIFTKNFTPPTSSECFRTQKWATKPSTLPQKTLISASQTTARAAY